VSIGRQPLGVEPAPRMHYRALTIAKHCRLAWSATPSLRGPPSLLIKGATGSDRKPIEHFELHPNQDVVVPRLKPDVHTACDKSN